MDGPKRSEFIRIVRAAALAAQQPTVREITAEELDDLFDQEQVCEMHISFGITVSGKPLWQKRWKCTRLATHVVVFTCPGHGSLHKGICDKHLKLIRSGRGTLTCATCDAPAVWVYT